MVAFGWSGNSDKFHERYKKMEKNLDDFIQNNENVSILGISAGGSAVVNLYSGRKNKIDHVVTVVGRLRDPNIGKMWNHRANDLGVFKESLRMSENNINKLTTYDKEKILTIRPIYDDVVPLRTMTIDGARNEKINAVQHMISIFLAMTLYSNKIAGFLNK